MAFNCSPAVAEEQDYDLVRGILDYRNAKYAVELMNQGQRGFDELQKNPHLGELLLRMLKAQDVVIESPADAIAAVAEQVRVNRTNTEQD